MATPNCEFTDVSDCYSPFPLRNRFAVDQVPLELNRSHYTLETIGTRNPVHIRGPKKDLNKRLATLQVCVRVSGKQIVDPTIIFRNANPAEDPYTFPPGLATRNQNIEFEGEKGPENSFYASGVDVMWQKKAWADRNVSLAYIKKFNQQVMLLCGPENDDGILTPNIGLQMDNLKSQNVEEIRQFCWDNEIFVVNTPEDCTDLRAMIQKNSG